MNRFEQEVTDITPRWTGKRWEIKLTLDWGTPRATFVGTHKETLTVAIQKTVDEYVKRRSEDKPWHKLGVRVRTQDDPVCEGYREPARVAADDRPDVSPAVEQLFFKPGDAQRILNMPEEETEPQKYVLRAIEIGGRHGGEVAATDIPDDFFVAQMQTVPGERGRVTVVLLCERCIPAEKPEDDEPEDDGPLPGQIWEEKLGPDMTRRPQRVKIREVVDYQVRCTDDDEGTLLFGIDRFLHQFKLVEQPLPPEVAEDLPRPKKGDIWEDKGSSDIKVRVKVTDISRAGSWIYFQDVDTGTLRDLYIGAFWKRYKKVEG